MFAVRGTEGIHHVAVGVRSQHLGKLFLTSFHLLLSGLVSRIFFVDTYRLAFLFRIETQVLQEQHLARFQGSRLVLCLCAVVSKLNRTAESSSHSVYNLAQAELSLHFAFRLTHVAHDDERTTLIQDVLQRRQRTTDTGVVSNLTILVQWHIEVHTYNRLLTGEFVIFDSHSVKIFG